MENMEPTPIRIGDAERDAAVERLRVAMSEGRITMAEFDERMTVALAAKTEQDLAPLFYDLPLTTANPQAVAVPTSVGLSQPDAGQPPTNQAPRPIMAGIYGALWPMTLILCFATGWRLWWLVLLPVVLGPLFFSAERQQRINRGNQIRAGHLADDNARRIERQRRRDERRQLRG